MKAVRILGIAIVGYIALVAAFETLIGVFQPADASTLVITTTDAEGNPNDRVLSRLEMEGALYVAANHWPRRWYREAVDRPEVRVAFGGKSGAYRAVPASAEEHTRLQQEHGLGLAFRILVGFAPRVFLRLDPIDAGE